MPRDGRSASNGQCCPHCGTPRHRTTTRSATRPAERRYGSVADAAALTNTSLVTIRRRIADGTLTAYRFGPKLLRLDLDEVEALLRPVPTVGGAA